MTMIKTVIAACLFMLMFEKLSLLYRCRFVLQLFWFLLEGGCLKIREKKRTNLDRVNAFERLIFKTDKFQKTGDMYTCINIDIFTW